jgi:hypothetical protein
MLAAIDEREDAGEEDDEATSAAPASTPVRRRSTTRSQQGATSRRCLDVGHWRGNGGHPPRTRRTHRRPRAYRGDTGRLCGHRRHTRPTHGPRRGRRHDTTVTPRRAKRPRTTLPVATMTPLAPLGKLA